MVAMRNQGATLQDVGDHFGITRERVRQILKAANYHGHPVMPPVYASEEQKERKAERARQYSRAWYRQTKEERLQKQRDYRQFQYQEELKALVARRREKLS